MKAQPIRILDVTVIGPLMIYGGYRLSKSDQLVGNLLLFFGVSTIAYNFYNYIQLQSQPKE